MEENRQSYLAGSRKRPGTTPLPPEGIERPGIDVGAFFPSVRGSGSALSLIERPSIMMPMTRSGQDTSASAAAPVANWFYQAGKPICMREDYNDKFDASQQFLQ